MSSFSRALLDCVVGADGIDRSLWQHHFAIRSWPFAILFDALGMAAIGLDVPV